MPVPMSVRLAGRKYVAGIDHGVGALLTASSWLLARLPGQVVPEQRAELIQAIQSQDLIVAIRCGPAPAVRVYDGAKLLVEIPANGAG
jgi:hypothetical protein